MGKLTLASCDHIFCYYTSAQCEKGGAHGRVGTNSLKQLILANVMAAKSKYIYSGLEIFMTQVDGLTMY